MLHIKGVMVADKLLDQKVLLSSVYPDCEVID